MEVDVYIQVFFTSVLVGDELPDSRLGRFTPRYPLDTRLGGPQNRSGRRNEEKNLAPTGTRTSSPRPSIPSPVAIPTALSPLLTTPSHVPEESNFS
jgi:hypothetical protein